HTRSKRDWSSDVCSSDLPPGPKVQRRGNKKGPPARKLAALLRSLVYPPNLAVLGEVLDGADHLRGVAVLVVVPGHDLNLIGVVVDLDRKSTRLNSSHVSISYAVFCL